MATVSEDKVNGRYSEECVWPCVSQVCRSPTAGADKSPDCHRIAFCFRITLVSIISPTSPRWLKTSSPLSLPKNRVSVDFALLGTEKFKKCDQFSLRNPVKKLYHAQEVCVWPTELEISWSKACLKFKKTIPCHLSLKLLCLMSTWTSSASTGHSCVCPQAYFKVEVYTFFMELI